MKPEMRREALIAEIERQGVELAFYADRTEELRARIERLRALLVRYQVINLCPEDCDLYAETKIALEQSDR